ncbi:tetratricopeptide repeat protein [Corynebacterium sp. ES2794-CONJ1]|uniref:tetratricopeptide repeat protein n=1 Tax=unclassified Corynebacterium TaxID=2624378 RepID=UPI00216822E0|nr:MULTISPECIES: tetratricopeptide repeat protein [unclassified Corynebacterium]MCS4489812.1 tetratricopeptide repeat protein [Corynebacterium sp. ES2775-CONJ]MCS4491824.1 tetratricopeptide repeat protein [Corynebacterium sp. ES2715-CONJ3]MCS4531929.1 tetratricopeptide repeat protein [Corynebacterium sp. ES2730-CONJ]MCU9519330.1 tetratricopeptide repeat protein [Corynebacterium sp. ES2794-CONJ1]
MTNFSGAVDLAAISKPAVAGVPTFVDLTMDNIQHELVERSAQVPVIVIVGTPRSPESEQLKSDFKQLVTANPGKYVVAYVDADASPDIARMFGIQGLPTVVAFASGQPLANFEGGQPREALTQWLKAILEAVGDQLPGLENEEPDGDPRFEPATAALNDGDYDAAIAVYESILASEPKNQEALRARDSAHVLKRLNEASKSDNDPITWAQQNPKDIDAQFAAADAYIAAGAPEQAFDTLIGVLKIDTPKVRDRLLELFSLFDVSDARVIAARRAMASALF